MSDEIEVKIVVDDSDFKESHRERTKIIKTDHILLDEVDERSAESFMQVLSMARSAYTVGLGLIKMGGESISYFFRSMMSAAFGAIAILKPLLSAEAMVPGMQVTAALGLFELGVAVAAMVAAEMERTDIARGFRGAAMSLGALSQLIGDFYFL